jgi:pimeloyl-ACP methyl ester carboxylesterase
MRRTSRWLAVVATVLLVTLPIPPSTASAAGANRAAEAECPLGTPAGTPVPPVIVAGRHPVVFVHGWNMGPSSMDRLRTAVRDSLGQRVETFAFDYAVVKDNWAGDAEVSGCLAIYIDAVSRAARGGGGDGEVYLVGYSMGGLAIRYASSLTVQGVSVGDRLGGVITVDTPHRGSVWGGTDYARFAAEVVNWLPAGQRPLPNPSEDAARCLAPHTGGASFPTECGSVPPYLPDGIPVHQIAGAVNVARTFWGIPLYTYYLDGDSVVDLTSQRGYLGSGPVTEQLAGGALSNTTVTCTVNTEALRVALAGRSPTAQIRAALDEWYRDGGVMDDLARGTVSNSFAIVVAEANLTAGCSHMQITSNREALTATVDALTRWLDALPSGPPTWLYTTVDNTSAVGPTGTQRSATLDGRTSETSTSFWVGCDGEPAVATFTLAGGYRLMSTVFLLDTFTPDELVVRVVVKVDGVVADQFDLKRGPTRPVGINTTGAAILTFETEAIAGTCTAESIGYGIAYDAALFR